MKKWIGAAVCALCAALLAAGVPVSAAPAADTVPDAAASAEDAAAAEPGTGVQVEYFGERLDAVVATEPLYDAERKKLRG